MGAQREAINSYDYFWEVLGGRLRLNTHTYYAFYSKVVYDGMNIYFVDGREVLVHLEGGFLLLNTVESVDKFLANELEIKSFDNVNSTRISFTYLGFPRVERVPLGSEELLRLYEESA